MTAHHLDFDATHAHIGAADDLAQRRANIARRAEIMAELYADRRLSPATGCAALSVDHVEDVLHMAGTNRPAASCEHCAPPVRECQMCGATDPAHRATCEQLHPGVCEWLPSEDSEGGSL